MKTLTNSRLVKSFSTSNSYVAEWEFNDVNYFFDELINIASSLPRTKTIKIEKNYWHGVCKSLVFRFPDDLEIQKKKIDMIPWGNGLIQIKSSSRIGISDLGVNKKRVDFLYQALIKKKPS